MASRQNSIDKSSRNEETGEKIFWPFCKYLEWAQLPNSKNILFKDTERKYDAAYDIIINDAFSIRPGSTLIRHPLGVAVRIPEGYVGQLDFTSSSAVRYDEAVILGGKIDPGYEAQLYVSIRNGSGDLMFINPGTRLLQLQVSKAYIHDLKQIDPESFRGSARGFR